MSIELFEDDTDVDTDLVQYECWYWSVIEGMADLILNNGRDKVMADVAETVLKRLSEGTVSPIDVSQL